MSVVTVDFSAERRFPELHRPPAKVAFTFNLHDVITGATGNSWALHTNCPVPGPVPTSPANNDFTPGFATALMNKDLGLALAALESTGTVAPLGAAAAALYDEFAQDNGDKDFSAIITSIRESARS